MLQDARTRNSPQALDADTASDGNHFIDIDRLLAVARRQWRVAAIGCVIGALLAIAYISTAVPKFTATSNLLIDSGSNRLLDELSAAGANLPDDTGILSQVEILKSSQISLRVIDQLNLTDEPSFAAPPASLLQKVRGTLRSIFDVSNWFREEEPETVSTDEQRRAIVQTLQSNLDVARIGRSSVLGISYTSPDPRLAASISDAFVNAYLVDQLDSKFDATRRASTWLQERIEELRQRSIQSDRAVQQFRAENGLISANGQLVSDQQLSELNSQLVVAQNEAAAAKARHDAIKALVDSGDTNAVVSDSLGSTVVNNLRTRYLDAAKREAEISNRLGPQHQQAIRLREEMGEYRRLMFTELTRLADSYQNDYQVALAREQSVRKSVDDATGVSNAASTQQVQLRELEREADTYRNLYQTFLQRYQEAIQQESFPITEARIITKAEPPLFPSQPKKIVVLALGLMLGGGIGAALGAFREFRDRFFRTGDQVKDTLGLEPLGLVSRINAQSLPRPSAAELETRERSRILSRTSNVTRFVVDHPMSSFAETLRSAKIAIDLTVDERRARIVGIGSALPGEGKSTVSANLAALLALQGARTLLIDCDLRNPGLTRALVPHAKAGLVEAILQEKSLSEVIYTDPDTNLCVVPAVIHHRIPHTSELLTSNGMAALLNEAAQSFDYILVDLPPIGPVVDARAFAGRMDGMLLVVEWGRTARRVVRSTMDANPRIAEKCLGVVLNKVDSDKMKFYQEFGSSEYYNVRYSSYYREPKA